MPSSPGSTQLCEDIASFRRIITAPVGSNGELAERLTGIYEAFREVDFARYDVAGHREVAPELMSALLQMRTDLRDQIAGWHQRGLIDRRAQAAIRATLRATRYASDILGEVFIAHDRLEESGETYRAFTGPHLNTQVAPRFAGPQSLPFASGDVLLVRGRLHNSAAIARIGDIDSQFSHVAIVYIDPAGEHWAVEALIEEGSVILPLKQVLEHGLGRAIVFRHRDPALAQRAAYIIHDRVRRSLSRDGKRILYDFSMQLDNDPRLLFCSKLVRRAYKDASNGSYVMPTFATRLDMKNRDFPDRIGVRALETFAPGDMELEPDFDVVAEWQDYRVTSDLRLQDIVMDKLFERMERENFRFRETFKIKLISWFGRLSSHLSNEVKERLNGVLPKVPVNMSRSAIAAIAMLHGTAQPLLEEMRRRERHRTRVSGLPLHPREVAAELDRLLDEKGDEIGFLRRRSR